MATEKELLSVIDGLVPAFQAVTLRDYFAAKVVSGLASNQVWLENVIANGGNPIIYLVEASFEVADLMLAERAK